MFRRKPSEAVRSLLTDAAAKGRLAKERYTQAESYMKSAKEMIEAGDRVQVKALELLTAAQKLEE